MSTPAEIGASKDRICKLVTLLAEEQKWTSIEIAETLWLALQIQPVAKVVPDEPQDRGSESQEESSLEETITDEEQDEELSASASASPAPRIDVTIPAPKAEVLPPQVLPVWIPDPPMLTDALAMIRALKPLLRQVAAGVGGQLNEAATVEHIARTRLWLPVLEPKQEPWFDIVLVVDRSSSMHIWQRLVKDLVRILRRYGAFRDVQVFDLEVNSEAQNSEEKVLLRSHPDRPGHRFTELIEQRGRRIAIILSDCAGQYWWDGSLLSMLQTWSKVMPTVVWQMLPEWMWERTALGRGTAVALSNDSPGAANQQLIVRVMQPEVPDDAKQRSPLPVVTSEVRDLTNWSLMVAGDRREITPGFLLPQRGGQVPQVKNIEDMARDRVEQNPDIDGNDDIATAIAEQIESIARERIHRFRLLSSPQARRLVMLLAAAPVITLPVMRLIRDSMLHEVRSPLPVAEVFLSGLVQRLPGQEQVEPDVVQYDFLPKVREVLLQVLPEVDTIDVLNSVSAAVEKRWNQVSQQDFRAFLMNPRMEAPEGLAGVRSFASVTADILEQLGGDYARFAQQLRHGSREAQPFDPEPEFPGIPPLEDFSFEPPIIVFEADEPELPPIEMQSVVVATITLETRPATPANLQQFGFRIATVEKQKHQWVVNYRPGQAWRYVEPMQSRRFLVFGSKVELEMVFIPGGEFIMGSPSDEPERNASESPQHRVTVPDFYLGRYPVTQAQWRAVVAMPQVERNLKANPSQFKGDDRPVENVSWNDAVEFSARLSRQTGSEYRLPTEAEWEYACRAGTTTPFHFGETITIDLANYNGSYTYGDGSKGEYRRETTPVAQFGVANAFGLSDMHGNVREWCQDPWHENYQGAPTDGSVWSEGENDGAFVLRGGSWSSNPRNCRSAYRTGDDPDGRIDRYGFRVVCAVRRPQGFP